MKNIIQKTNNSIKRFWTIIDGVLVSLLILIYVKNNGWRVIGSDYNWDLLNYHLNNPTNEQPLVLHPAGIQSFFPTFLDRILLPIHTFTPAPIGGLIMLIPFLTNYLIIRYLFVGNLFHKNVMFPNSLSLVSIMPSMAISQINNSMGDIVVTPFALISIYFILVGIDRKDLKTFFVSGLSLGLLISLKLSFAYFIATAGLLMLMLWIFRKINLAILIVWLTGIFVSYIPLSISHSLRLFGEFKNPYFPFFNGFFKSPNFDEVNIRDDRFGIQKIWDYFRIPVDLASNVNAGTAELTFRDPRLLLFLITLIIGMLFILLNMKNRKNIFKIDQLGFLTIFLVLGYLIWGKYVGISRYLIPIEIMGLVCSVAYLSRKFTYVHLEKALLPLATFLLLIGTTLTTSSVNWGHSSEPTKTISFIKNSYTLSTNPGAAYLVAEAPLAFMKYESKFNSTQLWFGPSFNSFDNRQQKKILMGKKIYTLSYGQSEQVLNQILMNYELRSTNFCETIQLRFNNGLTPNKVFLCETESIFS